MTIRHFCAEHLICENFRCYRKPDQKELKQLRAGDIAATWGDYHVPAYGIKCTDYKEKDSEPQI